MGIGQHSKNAPRFNFKRRGIVKYRDDVLAAVQFLLKKAGIKFTVEGMDISETLDGLNLRTSGTGANAAPWTPSLNSGLASFTAGTFAGIVPTISGIAIDTLPAPTLSILQSGPCSVWLKVSASLTSSDGYVYTYTFDNVIMESGFEVPDDAPTVATFYVPICSFDDGQLTGQFEDASIAGRVDDDGTSTSTGILYWV